MSVNNKYVSLSMIDKRLSSIIFSLLMFGMVMVYSARLYLPEDFHRQIFWDQMGGHPFHVLIGLSVIFIFTLIPSNFLQKLSGVMFGFGIFLLLMVAFRKMAGGTEVLIDGAVRSIPLGKISFQPAEFMKLFSLLFASAYAVRRKDRINETLIHGIAPIGFLMIVIMTLLLYQPDLGSTFVITTSVIIVLFLGGMSLKVILAVISILCTFFILMVVSTEWRLTRLLSYWDPCAQEYFYSAGYQLCNALAAFGHGGLLGTGLGIGSAKLGHLPLPHTDFIFSIIGEELGFIGVVLILLAFSFVFVRAIQIGREAMSKEKIFSGLLAQGIGVWLGLQTLIHTGVNTGLLPTKGLTLPFISYGGSSMIIVCAAVGILFRIDIENKALISPLKKYK